MSYYTDEEIVKLLEEKTSSSNTIRTLCLDLQLARQELKNKDLEIKNLKDKLIMIHNILPLHYDAAEIEHQIHGHLETLPIVCRELAHKCEAAREVSSPFYFEWQEKLMPSDTIPSPPPSLNPISEGNSK